MIGAGACGCNPVNNRPIVPRAGPRAGKASGVQRSLVPCVTNDQRRRCGRPRPFLVGLLSDRGAGSHPTGVAGISGTTEAARGRCSMLSRPPAGRVSAKFRDRLSPARLDPFTIISSGGGSTGPAFECGRAITRSRGRTERQDKTWMRL